jgi:tetratricopeptide (TPR) repeat protein
VAKISLVRRLLFILIVLLLFAAVVEFALRAVGWFYLRQARASFGAPGAPAVLCLGDSFTYGIGAGPDQSYPAHLGEAIGDQWRVINGGHPYMDSTSLLAGFSEKIVDAAPRLAIVMVGYNNQFKNPGRGGPDQNGGSFWAPLTGLKIAQFFYIMHVNRSVDAAAKVAAEIPPLNEFEVSRILTDARYENVQRVFAANDDDHRRVLESTATDPDAMLAKGVAYLIEGEGRLAEPLFFRVLDQQPDSELALMGAGYITLYRRELVIGFTKVPLRADEPWLAAGMATVLFERGRQDEAVALLHDTIESQPQYADGYLLLAEFLYKRGRPDEALILLERLEALEPWRAELHWLRAEALMSLDLWPGAERAFDRAFHDGLEHPSYYARLRRMMLALPQAPDAALEGEPVARALAPSTAAWRHFVTYAEKRLAQQIESRTTDDLYTDLAQMRQVCANLGVTMVLMSYPDRYAYDQLREFAADHQTVFVDNVAAFEEALRTTPPTLLFQPDGHCTSRGYRLMAQNLLATLRAADLVETSP